MRLGSLLVTVVGLGLAAGAVWVAQDINGEAPTAAIANPDPDLIKIFVARSDIGFGETIDQHDVQLVDWPRSALPKGAFFDHASLLGAEDNDPRRAKDRFFEGEVIIASKVSGFGEKITIVQKLGENTRAMAIRVSADTAVGGFVTPGDYVDIMMTQGGGTDMQTVTVLQNVRVIGVDQRAEETSESPEIARTITVEVTPEDGQILALAQRAGILSLALRTLEGVQDEPLKTVGIRDLLRETSPLSSEEQKKVMTIIVRRGVEASEVEVN